MSDIELICTGGQSCRDIIVVLNDINSFKVSCIGELSCDGANFILNNVGDSVIECLNENTCSDMTIKTSHWNQTLLVMKEYSSNIIYDNNYGVDIDPNSDNVNLDCSLSDHYAKLDQSNEADMLIDIVKEQYNHGKQLPCDGIRVQCGPSNCDMQLEKILQSKPSIFDHGEGYCFYADVKDLYRYRCEGNCANSPTNNPSPAPTSAPTMITSEPTAGPTESPTPSPSNAPTDAPTPAPTSSPTPSPTNSPTIAPTPAPTAYPTDTPTVETKSPSESPTIEPTLEPTKATVSPTLIPTIEPTQAPTNAPSPTPTESPTDAPSDAPSNAPTISPTPTPTDSPTPAPSEAPSISPTPAPTDSPTPAPTRFPTESRPFFGYINPTFILANISDSILVELYSANSINVYVNMLNFVFEQSLFTSIVDTYNDNLNYDDFEAKIKDFNDISITNERIATFVPRDNIVNINTNITCNRDIKSLTCILILRILQGNTQIFLDNANIGIKNGFNDNGIYLTMTAQEARSLEIKEWVPPKDTFYFVIIMACFGFIILIIALAAFLHNKNMCCRCTDQCAQTDMVGYTAILKWGFQVCIPIYYYKYILKTFLNI